MKDKQSTPALTVRKFKGLCTSKPINEIDDAELHQAENIMVDDDGVIIARPALQAWVVGPIDTTSHNAGFVEENTYYLGTFRQAQNRIAQEFGATPSGLHPFSIFYCGEGGTLGNPVLASSTGGPPWTGVPLGHLYWANLLDQGQMMTEIIQDVDYRGGAGTPAKTDAQTRGFQYEYDPSTAVVNNLENFGSYFLLPGWIPFQTGYAGADTVPMPRIGGEKAGATWTSPVEGKNPLTHVILHKDRAWGFSTEAQFLNNRLYFSEPGIPDSWEPPKGGFIDIGQLADGEIRSIVSYRDNLYIFKEAALWVLYTGGVPANWTLRKTADIGCLGVTARVWEGSIFWTGPNGVYQWDGNSVIKLSEPIQDVFYNGQALDGNFQWKNANIDAKNHGQFAFVRADIFQGNYIVVLQTGDFDKRVFCYNIKHKFWSEWTFGNLTDQIDDVFFVGNFDDDKQTQPPTADGLYFSMRIDHYPFPIIYKMETHIDKWGKDLADDEVVFFGTVRAGSTGTVLNVTQDINVSDIWGGNYEIRFIDGTDAFSSKRFSISSNTTGVNPAITIQSGLGFDTMSPSIGNHFYVVRRTLPLSKIETKRWDFGNPFSFKRFKQVVAECQSTQLNVAFNIATGAGDVGSDFDQRITSVGEARNISTPLGGNFRGQGMSVLIQPIPYGNGGLDLDPGDTPTRFKLYGLHVYAIDHGKVSDTIEQTGVNP